MRRLLILPFVLLLSALAPAVPAGAVDTPTCTLHVPGAVSVASPSTAIWPTFTGCTGETATWFVYDGSVRLGSLGVVDGVSKGGLSFHDSSPVGLIHTKTGGGANEPSFVVKYASTISLKSTRVSDLKVPLKGVVSHYVASVNEFRRWAHRPVAISYSNCADCPWHFLAMDKTDQYGVYSLAAVSPTARYYRAKVGETSTTWGRTSAPVND